MRLVPIAKPIRIRIKLGNSEHSSLDSLKSNFSIGELYPLFKDGRLERWLMQIGEVQLAHKTGDVSKKCGNGDIQDYILFLSLFFDEVADSLLAYKSAGEWSLNDYLSSTPLTTIKIIYAKTKDVEDIDWSSIIDNILSKENVSSIFEDPQLHTVYDMTDWGKKFSGLVKSEDDYKSLFTSLERFSRNNPQHERCRNIIATFYSECSKKGYQWASAFEKELSIDYITYIYQNECFQIPNINWGILFANCMIDWNTDSKRIEELLKRHTSDLLSFYKCCEGKGIEEASIKQDPWFILANSDDYQYVHNALEEWNGFRHYDKDNYNYGNMESLLGKQILDFLQSLINQLAANAGEWGEDLYTDSNYLLTDEKHLMELTKERRYGSSGYLEFKEFAKVNIIKDMQSRGVELATYILNHSDAPYLEIAKHFVSDIASRLKKYRKV